MHVHTGWHSCRLRYAYSRIIYSCNGFMPAEDLISSSVNRIDPWYSRQTQAGTAETVYLPYDLALSCGTCTAERFGWRAVDQSLHPSILVLYGWFLRWICCAAIGS